MTGILLVVWVKVKSKKQKKRINLYKNSLQEDKIINKFKVNFSYISLFQIDGKKMTRFQTLKKQRTEKQSSSDVLEL